jgi:anti-sigma-K factor RskA
MGMDYEKHVLDELPAYALGSLEREEERQVAEHLAGCSVCQAELKAYQGVVDQLPLAAPSLNPPVQLKARIMAQTQGSVSRPSRGVADNLASRIRSAFRSFSPAWGLISLVLLVALGASNLLLWERVQRAEQRQTDSFSVINLTGSQEAPDAVGLIVISPDGHYGTLVVDVLPTLNEDQQYQLWLVEGDVLDSGGVFSVGYSGYGALKVSSPEPLNAYTRFGVTIEPAGGSPGPTGLRVMGGDL